MPILDVPAPYMVRDQLADIVEIFDTLVPHPLKVEQEIEVANNFSSPPHTPLVVDQLVGVPSGSTEDYVISQDEVLQRPVKRRVRSATGGLLLDPHPPPVLVLRDEVELVKAPKFLLLDLLASEPWSRSLKFPFPRWVLRAAGGGRTGAVPMSLSQSSFARLSRRSDAADSERLLTDEEICARKLWLYPDIELPGVAHESQRV